MQLQRPIVDLARSFPRSAREQLYGIDILARAIDKARAELAGKLGNYIYFGCGMNRVLFSTLGVSEETFLTVVRDAARTDVEDRQDFVRDVDESLEAPKALTGQQTLDDLTSAQIDDAVVGWIRDVLRTPRANIDAMNTAFENMRPETPEQRASFDAELAATGDGRRTVATYADLLDLQEGRLTVR